MKDYKYVVGKYATFYKNGNMKMMYNFYDGYIYGNCVEYYSNGNIKEIGEYFTEDTSRTKRYDKDGNIMYMILKRYNKQKITKYVDIDDKKCHSFLDYSGMELCKANKFYKKDLGTMIFRYSDDKISYRENNGNVVKYYKSGYIKGYYKSKKLLFY